MVLKAENRFFLSTIIDAKVILRGVKICGYLLSCKPTHRTAVCVDLVQYKQHSYSSRSRPVPDTQRSPISSGLVVSAQRYPLSLTRVYHGQLTHTARGVSSGVRVRHFRTGFTRRHCPAAGRCGICSYVVPR